MLRTKDLKPVFSILPLVKSIEGLPVKTLLNLNFGSSKFFDLNVNYFSHTKYLYEIRPIP